MKIQQYLILISIVGCTAVAWGFNQQKLSNLPPTVIDAPSEVGIDDYNLSSNILNVDTFDLKTSSQHETISKESIFESKLNDKAIEDKPKVSKFVKEKISGNSVLSLVDDRSYPLLSYQTQYLPNDPGATQWWVESTGLNDMWTDNQGSPDTLLAIIDTGFALQHEDLQNRWHTNIGESGATSLENPSQLNCTDQGLELDKSCNLIDDDFDGIVDNESGATSLENPSQLNCTDQGLELDKSCNLIDDDSNGLIDDWRGWDFVSFDRSVLPGENNPFGSGVQHGTNVAGVAAATGDNGVGIAGVNWRTSILPIQALDDDGYGNSITVARAIRYAVDQGADVINISLGGEYPDALVRQTIEDAISQGVIVVAAAGNDGCNCIAYPANYPDVVSVGASQYDGERVSFSSYGANLDVLAPGVGITTTGWSANNQTSFYRSNVNGTSFASPIVSGIISSLVGQFPEATALELIASMTETTNRINISGNHSVTSGYGNVNANAANTRMSTPKELNQIYSFGNVINLANFSLLLYQCESNTPGTTPIYTLSKGSNLFFSPSESVRYALEQQSYTSSILTYSCMAMHHDNFTAIRSLNTSAEFFNRFLKQ